MVEYKNDSVTCHILVSILSLSEPDLILLYNPSVAYMLSMNCPIPPLATHTSQD